MQDTLPSARALNKLLVENNYTFMYTKALVVAECSDNVTSLFSTEDNDLFLLEF